MQETYTIGNVEYIQSELTWGQDKKLIELFNRLTGKAFDDEELALRDLLPLLTKYNLLDVFFGIILKPIFTFKSIFIFNWFRYLVLKRIDLRTATNSQLLKIFDDFFLSNKKLMNAFGQLGNIISMIVTTMNQENSEQSTSPSTTSSTNSNKD